MRELLRFYEQLDRKIFIDGTKEFADMNSALNIECGQTTPTPTTVMLMTKMLELDRKCRVLEIGTGSGYQAAFLAKFAGDLYTVEIHPELAAKAKKRLDGLGYTNITYKAGDGSDGWPEHAPYDRIVVTAAARQEPLHLLNQLMPRGIMIAPVCFGERQDLMMYCRWGKSIETYRIKGVRFVSMTGR